MLSLNRRVVKVIEEYDLPYYKADLCICEFLVDGKWVQSDTPYVIHRNERDLVHFIQSLDISDVEKNTILKCIDDYVDDKVSEHEYDMGEG